MCRCFETSLHAKLSYKNKFDLHENETCRRIKFSSEWFRTKTRFDTDKRQLGNSLLAAEARWDRNSVRLYSTLGAFHSTNNFEKGTNGKEISPEKFPEILKMLERGREETNGTKIAENFGIPHKVVLFSGN